MADQLSEFGKIFVFFILGALFVMIAYGISHLLSKNKPSPEKLMTYECGEEPEGNSHIQFNSRFYVIALIFLLFDVEIVFLFPWSAIFAQQQLIEAVPLWGWLTFTEMIVFAGILLVGLAYVWVKGDLEWVRPQQLLPKTDSDVPSELYRNINKEVYTPRAFAPAVKKEEPVRRAAQNAPPKPMFKPRILKKDN